MLAASHATRNDASGLGPPALSRQPYTSQSAIAYRLANDGTLEVVLGLSGARTGLTALSRDGGKTWSERALRGLPLGEVTSMVSTVRVNESLEGKTGAYGVLYATVLGHGVYVLPAGEYTWKPTAGFFAPRPSFFADVSGAGYSAALGGEGELTLPLAKSGAAVTATHASLQRVLLDDVVLPALWSLPDAMPNGGALPVLDSAAASRLEPLVKGLPAVHEGTTPAALSSPLNTAVRKTERLAHLLSETLTLPYHLAIVHDVSADKAAIYASLQPVGSRPFISKAYGGGAPLLGLEAPDEIESAEGGVIADKWPVVVARSLVAAGVYQLYDSATKAPVDPRSPLPSGAVWRQVAGLGIARGALQANAVSGDALTPAQAQELAYPQAWKAVSSLAGSYDGKLAATTETVRLNRTFVSGPANRIELGGDTDDPPIGLASEAVIFFQGGVFSFDNASTAAPKATLLFPHPQAGACGWAHSAAGEKLVVGLNMYEIQERDAGPASPQLTQATVAAASPFTAGVPSPYYRPLGQDEGGVLASGVLLGNSLYFDSTTGVLPSMRWPVGLFRVSGTESSATTPPPFSAGASTSADGWKAELEATLKSNSAAVAPPTSAGACFGAPDSDASTATLVSVAENLCCGPQRYFFVGSSPNFVYVGRTGGGIKRLPLSKL